MADVRAKRIGTPSIFWPPPRNATAIRRSARNRKPTGATSIRSGPRGVYDEAKRFAEAITMAYHRATGTRHAHRPHL